MIIDMPMSTPEYSSQDLCYSPRILHRLVHDEKLLTLAGSGRGTVYYLQGLDLPHPDDVFGKTKNSQLNSGYSRHLGPSSPHNVPSSPLNAPPTQ